MIASLITAILLSLPILEIIYYSNEPIYNILIDAGSTGSRAHVYYFVKRRSYGYFRTAQDQYQLIDESFFQVKPGLSHYLKHYSAGDTSSLENAFQSIRTLLLEANEIVPIKYQAETVVNIQATAGLRLINTDLVNELFKFLRSRISQEFKYVVDQIEVMDGTKEAEFAYKSILYLQKEKEPFGIVEMGGASVQVVLPHNTEDSVYSDSYLGLGLIEARFNCHKKDSEDCFRSLLDFELPSYLKRVQKIYLLSYFHDKTVGVLEGYEEEDSFGKETVWLLEDFEEYKDHVCEDRKERFKLIERKDEYLCFDVIYMHRLLEKISSHPSVEDVKFIMKKKVKGYEIGWYVGWVLDWFGRRQG